MRIGTIDANDMLIEAELDGKVYNIGLSWNEEGQLWTLSIRDLNLSILASGIGVVPNWPLLRQVRQPEFPQGEIAVDFPRGETLTRSSFTDGIATMFYLSPSDLI